MGKKIFLLFLLLIFYSSLLIYSEGNDNLLEIQKEIDADNLLLLKNPDNAIILNRMGFNFYRLGKIDEAFILYQKSIKLNSALSTPYNNLGAFYLLRKNYDEAEKNFLMAIKLSPDSIKPLYNLAVTYFRQKKYWLAVKTYLKVKRKDAKYVKERDNKNKAKKEIAERLKEDPDNEILLGVYKEIEKDEK